MPAPSHQTAEDLCSRCMSHIAGGEFRCIVPVLPVGVAADAHCRNFSLKSANAPKLAALWRLLDRVRRGVAVAMRADRWGRRAQDPQRQEAAARPGQLPPFALNSTALRGLCLQLHRQHTEEEEKYKLQQHLWDDIEAVLAEDEEGGEDEGHGDQCSHNKTLPRRSPAKAGRGVRARRYSEEPMPQADRGVETEAGPQQLSSVAARANPSFV